MPIDLTDVRDLMVDAEGIEAQYGPNAYSEYLRTHKRRPTREEAAGIGIHLGGRCRANDGTMQPTKAKPDPVPDGKCAGGEVPPFDGECQKCGATENDSCPYETSN